jgi:hypothetical protein
MTDTVCAVCQEQMPCESYNAELEQGPIENAFRLSCKHAFHSTCLILAFRTSASTACPCCRNVEGGQVITRGRYSLHITEVEPDEDEEEEIDVMELMDNDAVLRKIRTQNKEVKDMRSDLKKNRKEFNVLRDKLRKTRREHVNKALKEFRDNHRKEFRIVQETLVKKAADVHDKEKEIYIEMTSESTYDYLPWREYHEAERSGIQFKLTSGNTRHTDPWNSSFWYA